MLLSDGEDTGGPDALVAAELAAAAGVRIETGAEVTCVEILEASDGDEHVEPREAGVLLDGLIHGEHFHARAPWILSGVAPWTMEQLRSRADRPPSGPLPARPSGSQLKINLLVSRLPRLRSGDDPSVAFAGTFHVDEAMSQVEALHAAFELDAAAPERAGG